MRVRSLARSLAVGAIVLGLAGAGAASAQAWPKPKPTSNKWINKEINKTWNSLKTSDDDHIVSDSVIFQFGPLQSGNREGTLISH